MLTYCQPPAGYITHSRSRIKQMSSCAFLVSGLSPSICWTGLAPYKLPRALDSLLILIYQQPSSTTLYYSYLRVSALIEIRLSNETRGNYVRINIKSCSSEQGVWSPQTWRRTSHHVQLLSSCYINSLRQPYRPALTYITFCHAKSVFRPSSASVIS